MLSRSLSFVTTILFSIRLVLGGDICAYTSRDCLGGFICCSGILEKVCCRFPVNYGWSVKFQNMPNTPYWFGTTFGDDCVTQTGGASSDSGSICPSVWNGPTYLNWKSGRWVADIRVSAVESREIECMRPNVVGFIADDGIEHQFSIAEGSSEPLEGDLRELSKLEGV